jgi:chemotaxis methyl-accepting protein methylase
MIRFWVAGCSTGEEAYTLAMICRECMKTMVINPDIKIFATDIDNDAVIHAANGIYPKASPLICHRTICQNTSSEGMIRFRSPAISVKWWFLRNII